MSQIEKLVDKLRKNPKDLKFSEAVRIFWNFGYIMTPSGKTSGASVTFKNTAGDKFTIHKPHPGDELPVDVAKRIKRKLTERGLI